MAVAFQKQVKYMNITLVAVSVILLLKLLFDNEFGAGTKLDMNFKEPKADLARSALMVWEFFWLVSITIGFLWIARNAASKANLDNEHKMEMFEPKFFKYVAILLIITAFLTLAVPAFFGDRGAIIQFRDSDNATGIDVQANQFQFQFNGQPTITLQKGEKYVFRLTTIDTTHGFGLFNSDNLLLGQAQITPGYTTDFVFRFDSTGIYTIRCMEYCGLGHDVMVQAAITVV